MNRKILVFVPTYEEVENVTPMVEQISAAMPGADIMFVDDNSPDGTGQKLDELTKKYPKLTVRHRAGKLGIGGAHFEGIAYAYDNGYDVLVTLDCDFTHSPGDIPALVAKVDDADLVVGSRYLAKDSLPGWSPVRKFLTTFGHVLTVNMLGVHGDATGAFRVYNLKTIPRELFELVRSRGYAFFFESLYVAQANDLRIAEVPITLPARTYGHSKMNVREVQRSVKQLMDLTVANAAHPSQFRLPKPLPKLDESLVDPQDWNEYWEGKRRKSTVAYDLIATVYRNLIIKRRLNEVIHREFPEGASLLHAGCGSGQVDQDLHKHVDITAVDISVGALEIYRRENPKAHALVHASIFALPFPAASFDGAYNLGVVEHFHGPELKQVFAELHRVVKPGGKLVMFWPHAYATSVAVLNGAHMILNDVLHKNVRLHPAEHTLVHNEAEAANLLAGTGFTLRSYKFGPGDVFVQAVVIAERDHEAATSKT